jgi:hypothetical protein
MNISGGESLVTLSEVLSRGYYFAKLKLSNRASESSMSTSTADSYSSKTSALTHSFRFLDLPAELRATILELILTTCLTSDWQYNRERQNLLFECSFATWWDSTELQPRILGVSRQLLHEGLPILYGKNNFELLSDPSDDYCSAIEISPRTSSAVWASAILQ